MLSKEAGAAQFLLNLLLRMHQSLCRRDLRYIISVQQSVWLTGA